MTVLRYLLRRLRALWGSEEIHDEIAEELRFHIELRAEENVRRGMTPEEARREAERQFGRFDRIKEEGYEVRGGRWLEAMWQDLRYGVRMLLKHKGFTAVAVLSLALGIGANIAIFSLADKVMMRKLPIEESDRLVVVSTSSDRGLRTIFTYPDFADYRDRNEVFEGLVCYVQRPLTLSEGGQAERLQGMIVSGNYFTALRVRPALGRGFLPEEDNTRGSHPVVVLSYGLWQRRFGADPGLLGRTVNLNGYGFTVVGIAPPGVRRHDPRQRAGRLRPCHDAGPGHAWLEDGPAVRPAQQGPLVA